MFCVLDISMVCNPASSASERLYSLVAKAASFKKESLNELSLI